MWIALVVNALVCIVLALGVRVDVPAPPAPEPPQPIRTACDRHYVEDAWESANDLVHAVLAVDDRQAHTRALRRRLGEARVGYALALRDLLACYEDRDPHRNERTKGADKTTCSSSEVDVLVAQLASDELDADESRAYAEVVNCHGRLGLPL